MTVAQTVQMLEPYVESVDVPYHLSSLFKVPRNGIHNQSKVKYDVRRTSRDIAFPMKDPAAGYHMNSRSGFSSKEAAPPAYKEGFALSADELMGDRAFGKTEYAPAVLITRAQEEIGRTAVETMDLIKRGIELQAAQLLQTGQLAITDDAGATVFSEDFKPKATHFPNASVLWATTASAVPLIDIGNLCDVLVKDGKKKPMRVHMNSTVFAAMRATDSFKAAMDKDYRTYDGEIYRLNSGARPTYPEVGGGNGGGVFRGVLEVRNYSLDLYVYDGSYNNAQTGTDTKYLLDSKCVIESGGRMDATFGGIHNFGTDGRANRLLAGGRMTNAGLLSDMSVVAWISPNGSVFNAGMGSRALLIPVAIDTFGCLTISGF